MNIFDAADVIKELYQSPNSTFSTQQEMEKTWEQALTNFRKALNFEDDPRKLEACIMADPNWELSVDERIQLGEKTKRLGASSEEFLIDYYGYLAAHLDPSPEKASAASELERLTNNPST